MKTITYYVVPVEPGRPCQMVGRDEWGRLKGNGYVSPYSIESPDTGLQRRATSGMTNDYEFKIGEQTKWDNINGCQIISPEHMSGVVQNMSHDTNPNRPLLLVLNCVTGMVSFLPTSSNGTEAERLRKRTRDFYALDERRPASGTNMPNFHNTMNVERAKFLNQGHEYALCGNADGPITEKVEAARVQRFISGIADMIRGRMFPVHPDLAALSAGVAPNSSSAPKTSFAATVAAGQDPLPLSGNPSHANASLVLTQSSFKAATGPGKPHPSFGLASPAEVQRLVDLPVGSTRHALVVELEQRGHDRALGSATPIPDALETWGKSDAELDKKASLGCRLSHPELG